MPVGFSEQVALRREHCDMTPKSQNSGVREASQRCQLLCNSLLKHVSMVMIRDTTEEELWGQYFPIGL
jgi:hypothetical protein